MNIRRRLLAVCAATAVIGVPGIVLAQPSFAAGNSLFAYADGGATEPSSCPQTADNDNQCTLEQALDLATDGDTIELATDGSDAYYLGLWDVDANITIEAADGTHNPTLEASDCDGGCGDGVTASDECGGEGCDGAILEINDTDNVTVSGVTFLDGDNDDEFGGAIDYTDGAEELARPATAKPALGGGGATLTVNNSTFVDNDAFVGGAIANDGDDTTLIINNSTFDENEGVIGGAIANDGDDGDSTLTVTNSDFDENSAEDVGGAINNGDEGEGDANISDSTFEDNEADNGGAIDNGEDCGLATLAVTNTTFSDNAAEDGGAIDNGDGGCEDTPAPASHSHAKPSANQIGDADSSATVSDSTFNGNNTDELDKGDKAAGNTPDQEIEDGDGGAIDNGDNDGDGALLVTNSTFADNEAGEGGAIYQGDEDPDNSATIAQSTFSKDTDEEDGGDAIDIGECGEGCAPVTVLGDLFAEDCFQGGDWIDLGYNAAIDKTCLTNGAVGDTVDNSAKHLGPLTNNGGPTKTFLPDPDNVAIGLIPVSTVFNTTDGFVGLCARADQRGYASVGNCTAGSVEPDGTAPGNGGGGGGGGPTQVTMIVSSNDNPSTVGAPVTFTAAVTPPPGCGSVSWTIDGAAPPSGTPTATGATGSTFTLGPITTLTQGPHVVIGTFSGCGDSFAGTNGTLDQTVNPASPPPPPGITDPTIVAHVSSAHPKHDGWYRSPVTITFTCMPGSAPLSAPCPGPVVLTHNGKGQTVTKTITDTDGGSATVTLMINIDQTKPHVHVTGVTNGKTYDNKPSLTCEASDSLSGLASCHITQHHHTKNGVTFYTYTATATDNAGNVATSNGGYKVS